MPENGGKKDEADVTELSDDGGMSGDGTVDETEVPQNEVPAEDPVRQAERQLLKAQGKLADEKDKAKRNDEIAKALAQYEAVQVDLEHDETALLEHYHDEEKKLAPTDDEKKRVDKEAGDLKLPIDLLKASVAKQKTDLAANKATLVTRTAERDQAKETFEKTKGQIKGIKDRHGAADTIRKDARDARSKQKRLLAYYLLDRKLRPATEGEPQPIEFDAYKLNIANEAAAYGTLNRTVADLETTIKEDEKKLADDEKKLADLEKGLEAALRARLTALS